MNNTHDELCKIAVKMLKNTFGCDWAVTELVTQCQETPDAFGARECGEDTYLVEVKVSRSDFLADKKKAFRRKPKEGIGRFRYFMAPAGLISPHELPVRWGLIEVDSKGRPNIVAGKPPKNRRSDPEWWHHERNSWGERAIANSLLRRIMLGDDLSKHLPQKRARRQ